MNQNITSFSASAEATIATDQLTHSWTSACHANYFQQSEILYSQQ